jgi:hypothetical protein
MERAIYLLCYDICAECYPFAKAGNGYFKKFITTTGIGYQTEMKNCATGLL